VGDGVSATELRYETSDINMQRSCLHTFAWNLSHHSDASVDNKCNFCTDIILFSMFVKNEKLPTYQTPPSSGNIVPVTSSEVSCSVPVTYYTFDLSVLS